ncbi:Zinc finger NHR/GATA-type protein [Dioscorea alata]|uniref:Zinc finger NHR/GATA-type protein n=1 Tax=Dioscorea alata TaxID=55571 RepID=A0ACB7WE83_DIOAL|nr:Zinc finger NHR/GATA-type protein [Dioscorea alata]
MLSTAMRTVSSSPWRSRGNLDSVIAGYDRIEKTYVRRRKTAENQPGSEVAMASSPPSEELKTCADCRTSMTPLWRKGPYGPKSLCNACGIRYRRRRPMANEGGGSKAKAMKSGKSGGEEEKKERMVLLLMQHRSKNATPEEILGSISGYGRQEAEAALLLMALSSGLVIPS